MPLSYGQSTGNPPPQIENYYDYNINLGLSNLGNTCYMNAVIQVLSNCLRLKSFYLKCPLSVASSRAPYLSDRFKDLIIQLSSNNLRLPVRPFEVLDCVRQVNHTFRGFHQQDAQEFLRAFLYEIHDEIKFMPIPELQYVPLKSRSLLLNREKYTSKHSDDGPSLIMDIFQGSTVSSVQCKGCLKISRREEQFIDLSLPLVKPANPSSSSSLEYKKETQASFNSLFYKLPINDDDSQDRFSYFSLFWTLILNFFLLICYVIRVPYSKLVYATKHSLGYMFNSSQLHLTDCLEAFFNEDELTGENMYFCKRCNRACNGVKSTRLFRAPEILVIHLKRFKTDFSYASKLNAPIDFPLTDLDLSPYFLTKPTEPCVYDLTGVICHLGMNSSSGHYISYVRSNNYSNTWIEFDDDQVTEIDPGTVLSANSSCYVLIYSKQTKQIFPIIQQAEHLYESKLSSSLESDGFYVSKAWLVKLSNFANPGPITTHEFLCPHERVQPALWEDRSSVMIKIAPELWDYLYSIFGCNDPIIRELTICHECYSLTCNLRVRRENEGKLYLEMRESHLTSPCRFCALNCVWFNAWRDFVIGDRFNPPDSIDNSRIAETFTAYWNPFQQNDNYELVTEPFYDYMQSIYGGGPKLVVSKQLQVNDDIPSQEPSCSRDSLTDRESGICDVSVTDTDASNMANTPDLNEQQMEVDSSSAYHSSEVSSVAFKNSNGDFDNLARIEQPKTAPKSITKRRKHRAKYHH